jgi:hypothetical protein
MEARKRKKSTSFILGGLQAFIGLGAVGGGLMLIIDPSGSQLGLPLAMLQGSPFPDYLIPGLFLFTVNGLGSLVGAVLSFTRQRYAGEAGMALGAILMAWITIQVAIIRAVDPLHVLYFALGLLELALGLAVRRERGQAA